MAFLFFGACTPTSIGAPSASSSIPSETGSLTSIVASLSFSVAGVLDYAPPTASEKAAFRAALAALLNDDGDALTLFQDLGLAVTRFSDTAGPVFFLIRETGEAPRGWGLYAVNTAGSRRLVIEAPHPIADSNTEDQAAALFLDLSARALLIAGSHRCASAASSPCSGTTAVCSSIAEDEPYRLSDAAHSEEQVFQTAHDVLMDSDGLLTAVALHGFAQEAGEPHAFVSDGTESIVSADSLSNRFVSALKTATGVSNAAQSCNDGSASARLCGTEDLQGRSSNESPNACTTAASSASERFLHVEQSLDLRTEGGSLHPDHVEEVLSQLF